MRLNRPSQRTKVSRKYNCSWLSRANGSKDRSCSGVKASCSGLVPGAKLPSNEVSQAGQCRRVTIKSPPQTGHFDGFGYMPHSSRSIPSLVLDAPGKLQREIQADSTESPPYAIRKLE